MSVVDTAKTAYDLAKKGMTLEFQETIMQLREEALELQEQNLRLTKENAELREKLEWTQNLQRKRALYWCDGDDTPYCPYCWERNKLAIHLSMHHYAKSRGEAVGTCQACSTTYTARGADDFRVTASLL